MVQRVHTMSDFVKVKLSRRHTVNAGTLAASEQLTLDAEKGLEWYYTGALPTGITFAGVDNLASGATLHVIFAASQTNIPSWGSSFITLEAQPNHTGEVHYFVSRLIGANPSAYTVMGLDIATWS